MKEDRDPLFFEPGDGGSALALANRAIPLIRRYWAGVEEVHVDPESLERLRDTVSRPTIVCPNHPTLAEPSTLFDVLSGRGFRTYYLSDREVLRTFGPARFLLARAGAYTVRRGTVDRESINCTRQLLLRGATVAMYPEGETYGLNDTLINFLEGVAQLGFWGVGDRREAGLDPDVRLLPLAVKYYYGRDMEPVVEERLGWLEEQLDLRPAADATRRERLRAVAHRRLCLVEEELGLPPGAADDLPGRLRRYYETGLAWVTDQLGVEPRPGETIQTGLRRAFAAVGPETEPLVKAVLARLQRFQAVSSDYLHEDASAERWLDVLGRFELDLTDRWRRYPRHAHVAVGRPISLGARWPAYRADRKAELSAVTRELQAACARLLEGLSRWQTPLGPVDRSPQPW